MEIPVQLVQAISGYAVRVVADEIRTMGRPQISTEHTHDNSPGAEPVRGCPACRIHDAASTAKGHLDGIVSVGNSRGQIPDVMRPELKLVAKDLDEALETIEVVRERAPSLNPRCDAVCSAIDQAKAALPAPDDLNMTNAHTALNALTAVHREATVLGVEYFELEKGNADSDALRRWYNESKQSNLDADTALTRLREVLGSG